MGSLKEESRAALALRRAKVLALQEYAEAWRAGDVARLLDAYSDDVVFHYFGDSDVAGTYEGKEATMDPLDCYLGARKTMTDVLMAREMEELFGQSAAARGHPARRW